MWLTVTRKLTGTTVTALDSRTVRLADRSTLAFDRLLLATGDRPRQLPLAAGLDHVHVLRTMADLGPLRRDLEPGNSLLVIGAGLVGLEVAATAREMGCEVTVLEAGDRPRLHRHHPPQRPPIGTITANRPAAFRTARALLDGSVS